MQKNETNFFLQREKCGRKVIEMKLPFVLMHFVIEKKDQVLTLSEKGLTKLRI
jgi:hypothetical protein